MVRRKNAFTRNARRKKTEPESPEQTDLPVRRRRRRRSDDEERGGVDIWLISFTDVMALMLTFFVLLYAMAEPETRVWSEVVASLQEQFNVTFGALRNPGSQPGKNVDMLRRNPAEDLNYLSSLLERLLEQYEELEGVNIQRRGETLVIEVPSDFVFQPGSAAVGQAGKDSLFILGGTLGKISNRIEVYGHTDPEPVSGATYGSNWDLSLARAASVAALLRESGYRRDIVVQGWADRDFATLDTALPLDIRQGLARRVDIVVHAGDDLKTEDNE